jgi:DNA mismatch repair protein MutS
VTIDQTTLNDLSFFKGEHNVFNLLNCCTTQAGSNVLRKFVRQPAPTFDALLQRQQAVKFWMHHINRWTDEISNGTIVMIEKYYESSDGITARPGSLALLFDALFQKIFNRDQYSFVRFSVTHLIDFLKGCQVLSELAELNPPQDIAVELETMHNALQIPLCNTLVNLPQRTSQKTLLALSFRARREIKHVVLNLIAAYARLDALHAMAVATLQHNWQLPQLLPAPALIFEAEQMYHPLLKNPIAYDIALDRSQNFVLLTGANMSGKSTLIRSLGVTALLAHMGMGVPAANLRISFLEGIISNMHVEDDITLGESYFFAEVKRMKITAQKLNNSKYHLVLMDELFKGTNVHDAYECSRAVIDGLLAQKDSMMILSTHLYELADDLKSRAGIVFKYCHTQIDQHQQFHFTYQLKDGVSNDRIGYLVLKQEGVLDLLKPNKS